MTTPTIKYLLKNAAVDNQTNQQLLLHILQQSRSFLISHEDYCLTDDEFSRYQTAIAELQMDKPLAYVMGVQGFWKHDFIVNEHTLIPRPDTEILVETVLNFIKNSLSKNKQTLQILDLGTGSGCIAISLAHELPNAQVIAVDVSQPALSVAKQNAERVGVSNIQFLQSDWFSELRAKQKFDIIVSNPPYIDPHDGHLAALTHEPITALTAENQGLADIEHIVTQACHFLEKGGLLAVEHGYDQALRVQKIFEEQRFAQVKTIKDYGSNDRVTLGVL